MTGQTTEDRFLGGQLIVEQPKNGYRAGADPVFLAAATRALAGQSVLELGTGAGTALLCLGARINGLSLTGIEQDLDLKTLAVRNSDRNQIPLEVFGADLTKMPKALRARSFDHVITNPPFFDRSQGTQSADAKREAGRGRVTPLKPWVDAGIRRLAPKGRLTMVWPAGRMLELLVCLDDRMGGVEIKPLAARAGRNADLILVTAQKGSRSATRLLAPLILHKGDRHERDGDSYTPEASAILRQGAALDWA